MTEIKNNIQGPSKVVQELVNAAAAYIREFQRVAHKCNNTSADFCTACNAILIIAGTDGFIVPKDAERDCMWLINDEDRQAMLSGLESSLRRALATYPTPVTIGPEGKFEGQWQQNRRANRRARPYLLKDEARRRLMTSTGPKITFRFQEYDQLWELINARYKAKATSCQNIGARTASQACCLRVH
jgi:hypothetical protein